MKETIFYLEGRGSIWIYHFFVLMLGGLYYIDNKQYNVRGVNDSVLMNDTSKHVLEPTTSIKYPIKIYMKDIFPFHHEAFEIIKDKYELVEDLSQYEDYEIVSIYGETLLVNNYCDHPHEIFNFIRNLFLERMPKYKIIPGKRIYITRKITENYKYRSVLTRFMINEMEIMKQLEPYGFEYVQLEDLSIFEKIKLFMEAEVIMSSHSAGLTFTLFCDAKTKIIEILKNGSYGDHIHIHYINLCQTLGIDYNRYSDINEDINGNFNLDFKPFEKYLHSIDIRPIFIDSASVGIR